MVIVISRTPLLLLFFRAVGSDNFNQNWISLHYDSRTLSAFGALLENSLTRHEIERRKEECETGTKKEKEKVASYIFFSKLLSVYLLASHSDFGKGIYMLGGRHVLGT